MELHQSGQLMRVVRFIGVFALLLPSLALAQGVHPYEHHNERRQDSSLVHAKSLQEFFRKGTLYGHARYFFMSTQNQGPLSDYFAHAAGMGIAYESAPFKGFQIGLSGFFNRNLHSSDFSLRDPLTNQVSRYEIGLFDLERPTESGDMDRLEDFYLKYNWRSSYAVLGKQHIRTPFINPQDGRMRPTLVDGLQLRLSEWKRLRLDAGLLFGISPRSTVKWHDIGESIGVYPRGVNTLGAPSTYRGKIDAVFLTNLGITYQPVQGLEIQLWNMYVDRLMHNYLLQGVYRVSLAAGYELQVGAQYIRQLAAAGLEAGVHDYLAPGHDAAVYGGRLGLEMPRGWSVTLNHSRIADGDRYLMPREWGRDPMFTFMPRERNEGFANVQATNFTAKKRMNSQLALSSGAGVYRLPAPDDFVRNKYGLPSYFQVNIDAYYSFGGWFQGLTGQLLFVYKGALHNTVYPDAFVINRVNMSLFNLAMNYHF